MDGVLRDNGEPHCGAPWDVRVRLGDHALLMREGVEEIHLRHAEEVETAMGEARVAASKPDARRLGRIQLTGECLSVLPSTVNGMELGAQ